MPQQQNVGAQIYSNTPGDNPIGSPQHGFNYNQYRKPAAGHGQHHHQRLSPGE